MNYRLNKDEFENEMFECAVNLSFYFIFQLPTYQTGDKVRVLSDKQLVQNLQQGHGGWNESMTAVRHFYFELFWA